MNGAKKITTVFDDQLNAKIQRKFDLVFNDKPQTSKSKNSDEEFGDGLEFGNDNGEEFVMEKNGKKSSESESAAAAPGATEINLDFSLDDETPEVPVAANAKAEVKAPKADDDGLGFSLDFDMDGGIETTPAASMASSAPAADDDFAGFSLDDADIGSQDDFAEATKKTVVVSAAELTNSNLEEFSLDNFGSHNGSAEHMSNEESRANIESTIKDIIRPKNGDTKEIDISSLDSTSATLPDLSDIENNTLEFREGTPSKGFDLGEMDEDAFSLDSTPAPKSTMTNDSTGDFDIGSLDDSFSINEQAAASPAPIEVKAEVPASRPVEKTVSENRPANRNTAYVSESPVSMGMGGSNMTTEDSMRFQGTIRALREEREEMLAQIKNLKADSKELEQDNLTLKANLDEAKIEITILRKRHMVELEDIKYRMTLSEEKKAMAEEKARQADVRREKLEQKVRIDFNQVKQREKELESKLELLSMDVDSQVHSRDQKILELRRKIDALEFNMENASIKEQKSLDDKRKLEDRLNKIMKTLRHSIKNLEDDIDHAQEDDDHQKEKN